MNKEIILISGASRGIGLSMANYFADAGHIVIGTSRNNFNFDNNSTNLIPIKLEIFYFVVVTRLPGSVSTF